jgi:hypothetical protein
VFRALEVLQACAEPIAAPDRDGTAFAQRFIGRPFGTISYDNRMSPLSLVIVLSLSAALEIGGEQAAPQRPTLIDLASEHGGIEMISLACGPRPSFETVVSDGTVIVHGTVVTAEGHLSADQQEVWTDYQVQPIQIIREPTSSSLSPPILFTTRGGSVVIEGLTITYSHRQNNSTVTLQVGDEVVLFGTMHDKRLIFNPISVFMVRDGVVRSNGDMSGFSADREALPLETFVTRVREIQR